MANKGHAQFAYRLGVFRNPALPQQIDVVEEPDGDQHLKTGGTREVYHMLNPLRCVSSYPSVRELCRGSGR